MGMSNIIGAKEACFAGGFRRLARERKSSRDGNNSAVEYGLQKISLFNNVDLHCDDYGGSGGFTTRVAIRRS